MKRGHFPEKPPNCRKEFYQVMKQCWTQDVEDRPLFTDIVQVRKTTWEKLGKKEGEQDTMKRVRRTVLPMPTDKTTYACVMLCMRACVCVYAKVVSVVLRFG